MQSIGYRQVKDALEKAAFDEQELMREVFQKTRVFARRQRTWLRDEPQLKLPPSCLDELPSQSLSDLRTRLWGA
jgi:tRNA A37 N6-isopentenylltransferase MiaA